MGLHQHWFTEDGIELSRIILNPTLVTTDLELNSLIENPSYNPRIGGLDAKEVIEELDLQVQ